MYMKKGGNCGCTKLWGGKTRKNRKSRKIKGGYVDFPSFVPSSFSTDAYYPYNSLAGSMEDPTSPNMEPSSRLFPDMVSGGKKNRKTRKTRK